MRLNLRLHTKSRYKIAYSESRVYSIYSELQKIIKVKSSILEIIKKIEYFYKNIINVHMSARRSESESWESTNTRSTNPTLAVKAPDYRINKKALN